MFTSLAALCRAAAPALARTATADRIRAAIIGNTVQGGMSDGSAHTGFHDADGTNRSKD